MNSNDEPVFFTAPAQQPPADPQLAEIAKAVRAALHTAGQYLISLPTLPTEEQKAVWMWHASLTFLAWDVAELAIAASIDSSSMRGARALNRMLVEYAARVHLYIAEPALAERHVKESPNLLRRVMKPVAAYRTGEPGIADVKKFVDGGSTAAHQPKIREMLEAMVATFVEDKTKRLPYIESLDAEYALGNGYVHGSQNIFFDIFDDANNKVHPRTRVLSRQAEVLRCINCMLALLAGIEKQYGQDFGVHAQIANLRSLGSYNERTTQARHDALTSLLGVSS